MDINQMRYFMEICSSGSMSKAAEKLHISQQGLSLSIRRLEDELCTDLFYRKPSGLVLTAIGKQFKAEAEVILQHVDTIYNMCSSKATESIRVALTTNLLFRLPKSLQQLLISGNEDISLHTIEKFTCDCEDMVLRDEADFGIVYGECDDNLFRITNLDYLQQVFIVNRSHRLAKMGTISIEDLDGVPLIVPNDRCRPGIILRQMFSDANVALNIAFASDRPRQTIDVVSANPKLGARIILNDVLDTDREHIKVLPLKNEDFLLSVCLISKKGKKLSIHERYLQRLIMDCFNS